MQSVYRISEGAGLALTTARYYTPSGRLIQRPWDGTFDEYLTYTLREQQAERAHNAKDLRYTDGGRQVYAGGGVEPDRHMAGPVEGFNPSRLRPHALGPSDVRRTSPQRFSAEGDDAHQRSARTAATSRPNFQVDDAMVAEYRKFLIDEERVKMDEAAWTADAPFIRAMIRFEHRRGALRHRRGPPPPPVRRPAGAVRPQSVPGGRKAQPPVAEQRTTASRQPQ